MVFNNFVSNVIYLPGNFEAHPQMSNETYNASLANTGYVSDRIINETVSVPNLKEYYSTRVEDLRHINHTADGKVTTGSGPTINYLEYLPYIQSIQILQQSTSNKPQTLAQPQHHHQPQQAHHHSNQIQQQQQQQQHIHNSNQMHQINQKPPKARKKAHQNQIRIPNFDGIDPSTSASGNVTTSGQSNSNRAEMMQGSSKRLYFCPLCNKMFKWARNLKRHQIVHTGEEPYKCTKCRRSFKTNYRRKLHEKMPHPLRYGCTLCLNQFLKEGELKTHLKNHHGIQD